LTIKIVAIKTNKVITRIPIIMYAIVLMIYDK